MYLLDDFIPTFFLTFTTISFVRETLQERDDLSTGANVDDG